MTPDCNFCSDDSGNADQTSKSSAKRLRNLTRVTHLLIADVESGAKEYRQVSILCASISPENFSDQFLNVPYQYQGCRMVYFYTKNTNFG
jgi:hypothetical protein